MDYVHIAQAKFSTVPAKKCNLDFSVPIFWRSNYRPLSTVLVKVAYYATSSARFFFQILLKIMLVCKIMLLFLNVWLKIKNSKLVQKPKLYIYC